MYVFRLSFRKLQGGLDRLGTLLLLFLFYMPMVLLRGGGKRREERGKNAVRIRMENFTVVGNTRSLLG